MLRGLVFRYSASSGIGAWLGTPTGPHASAIAWSATSATRSSSMRCWRASLSSSRCAERYWRARRRAAPTSTSSPPAIHQRRRGSPARQQRPAEHAGAAEDAQDRRREERVARVDRQPERSRTRRTRPPRAPPRSRQAAPARRSHSSDEHAAERRPDEHGRAQDLADPPRDVLGHVGDPGHAVEDARRCGGCSSATTAGRR